MNKRTSVDSILHENIAESEKSITDEVIELFRFSDIFILRLPSRRYFFC